MRYYGRPVWAGRASVEKSNGAMAGGRYDAARRAILVRREHGAPPMGGVRALRTWAWGELRIGVREVNRWPDGALAAVWPDAVDALCLPCPARGVRARVFFLAASAHVREAICREIGRALLGRPVLLDATEPARTRLAGDADALDFAACLLVHPGDVATALDADEGVDGYCRAHGVSPALVSRRLALLGEWCDRAGAGLAAEVLDAVERCDWRTMTTRASGE